MVKPGWAGPVFLTPRPAISARTRLGDYMVKVVKESVADRDAVFLRGRSPTSRAGGGADPAHQGAGIVPAVMVTNKIDTVEKEEPLPSCRLTARPTTSPPSCPSPPSGTRGGRAGGLAGPAPPEGPQLFPEDMVTDQPERQVCAEIIREKRRSAWTRKFPRHRREITTFRADDGIIDLNATIY